MKYWSDLIKRKKQRDNNVNRSVQVIEYKRPLCLILRDTKTWRDTSLGQQEAAFDTLSYRYRSILGASTQTTFVNNVLVHPCLQVNICATLKDILFQRTDENGMNTRSRWLYQHIRGNSSYLRSETTKTSSCFCATWNKIQSRWSWHIHKIGTNDQKRLTALAVTDAKWKK